jgi:hypothetical protein
LRMSRQDFKFGKGMGFINAFIAGKAGAWRARASVSFG